MFPSNNSNSSLLPCFPIQKLNQPKKHFRVEPNKKIVTHYSSNRKISSTLSLNAMNIKEGGGYQFQRNQENVLVVIPMHQFELEPVSGHVHLDLFTTRQHSSAIHVHLDHIRSEAESRSPTLIQVPSKRKELVSKRTHPIYLLRGLWMKHVKVG